MAATDNPKQRLSDIRTGEVSIVDDPANEREFNLIKNKGNNTMTVITKAAYDTLVKNLNAAKADVFEAEGALTKAAEGTDPKDLAEKAKALTSAMQKCSAALKAMPPFDPKEPDADDTKKVAEKANDQQPGQAGKPVDNTVDAEKDKAQADKVAKMVRAEVVKAMGGADIEGLKVAVKSTLGALAAVDNSVAKAIVMEVLKELPGATTVSQPSKVVPDEMGKVTEGEQGEMFLKMKKNMERLESELAEVKKARSPSQSGGDGNTDSNKPVNKGKNLWGNLL